MMESSILQLQQIGDVQKILKKQQKIFKVRILNLLLQQET